MPEARPTPPAPSATTGVRARLEGLRGSDVGKAAGLAGAMIVNNVVALLATVLFARLLDDYGSLASLLAYVLILSVVGQAMQVATAREAVLGTLGTGPELAATLRNWTRTLLLLTVALGVVSVLLRAPIAAAVGVEEEWAAAAGLPAGVLWLLLAVLRGALQGTGDYRAVGVSLIGEQTVRLISGVALAAAGLDVTGAFLGTPIALAVTAVWCGFELRRRIGELETPAQRRTLKERIAAAAASGPAVRLRDHVSRAWAAIAGLVVIAVLQNIDVIAAKHSFSTDVASSYGATGIAAKALVWVAMGAGFYLVPETSRRDAEGEDTRPVLIRALGIVVVLAIPALLIFAAVPRLLLRAAFGEDRLLAVDALLPLGIAFTLLALTYLAIQYLLALHRTRFLIPMGLIALSEPVLLLALSPEDPTGFAMLVLAIQTVACGAALLLAFRRPATAVASAPARSARPQPAADGSTPPG
jgi:O-antigen/teichoic acid export membrane protein